ncbi:MAG: dephospho-CoA kinase [Prosthecobacter sp.]|nr:dephospho-CoA kinase [Prosthecobacter sp.]
MQTWIITGGVACGKSSVCDALKAHGKGSVQYFSSDQQVQRLLDVPEIMDRLTETFGSEAVAGAGKDRRTDRDWLRRKIFADAGARRRLEEILHPGVLQALEAARNRARMDTPSNLFLAEVPLHYEIGSTVSADLVIVVAASQTVQVRRLMERRGLDESIIEQMLRAQWPIEAKVERADVVIWNDGDPAALDLQVLTLARQHWSE